MVHLRIVAPPHSAERALELLKEDGSVTNVIHLPGAAHKPAGDVILCDIAREDASVVIADLKRLDIPKDGSITLEHVETQMSEAAERAEEHAPGLPTDAVVWEDVESRTSEDTEVSASFLAFMVVAMLLAGVAIMLDQPILMVGAMVVGPEFGPLAAFCVAVVELRGGLARRSLAALAIGFPLGIALTLCMTLVFDAAGVIPGEFSPDNHPLTAFTAQPDFLSFFVAVVAGTAGVLSLTSTKSGALIGVLVSVTTIPAAANIAVATGFGDWDEAGGALAQLGLNLLAIVLAGVTTLYLQRRLYLSRRRRHRRERAPSRGPD